MKIQQTPTDRKTRPVGCGYLPLVKETLNKWIPFVVRQAHHERNQHLTVRPEPVEGLNQIFLKKRKPVLESLRLVFGAVMTGAIAMQTGCSGPEDNTKLFEDVTLTSGLQNYVGMTYGAAWGDFDGDGLADLYVTNHLNEARLYRNSGQVRFIDATGQFFAPNDLRGDKHGAAWADFDNDGRQDLVQLTGADRGVGSEAKRLFINRGDRFENIADAVGASNPFGRTRMPLWYDFDGDGRLDLFHGSEKRFDDRVPPLIFLQRDGRFIESADAVPFNSRAVPFCVLTQVTDGGKPDLLCRMFESNRASQVFTTATQPAKALDLLPATAFEDLAAGDFDNDGKIDVYLARKNPVDSIGFAQPRATEIIVDTSVDPKSVGSPLSFSFRSAGSLRVQISPENPKDVLPPDHIHIGSRDIHPDGLAFDLSKETAGIAGSLPLQPGAGSGVYLNLTPPDVWQVKVSGSQEDLATGKYKYQQIALKISSSELIADLKADGLSLRPEEAAGRLFMNRGGTLVEEGDKRGVNPTATAATNTVAGDFDNDMDLDLFVVGSGDVGKRENLLLLNRGNGHFDAISGAGGAAGNRAGVGDSVTMVDFDRDGFLDLLVATGGSMGRSLGLPSNEGGYHIYRNVGNGNHWLEIDLEGTASNRDGIGARVEVTAGGITQVRVQDGGIHNKGQNHTRLHFGLGKNAGAEKIRVQWPSGAIQELSNIEANRVMRIKEP